ncbi:sn-glycerol-3-phosphate ABC transporter ATP-binding protein UgpC [Agrobacterium tumefaciens]|uniref:ABC transporter ATP-binding protein n=1 Tax=Agrobacterium tumefaciens TaxID=358 RepID=UPI003013898E|nr:sn-glycerol-3-phosphate ABC transporter ATP-binding protein UgpC [Agrobacterium tumefaciens]
MTSVQIRSLQKKFGAYSAITDMNLTINDGEFVALVGPSGCGKSTLLRMISGLEEPTEGEILFNGSVVNELNPHARNVAMVFQNYALYPHMTVEQNIGFNLKIAGVPREERERRVADVARLLNLSDLLSRRPAELSGGQRQRVAMGRAIVRKPEVFLFDEPLSNLDAKLRVQMRGEIKRLHAKVRTTSVYVTHDQVEAMTLADRVVIMNRGNIEQVGPPLELYSYPQSVFVAGFIGSPAMNLLPASVETRGALRSAVVTGGLAFDLHEECPVKLGQKVIVGIRPEHISRASVKAKFKGRVVQIEPTGGQTHVLSELDGIELMSIVESDWRGAVGDAFHGGIDESAIHIFDAESGKRVPPGGGRL